jgi:hypothetical protein
VHRNPEIFPEPTVFDPERWLQEDSHDLDKYLVSFSKGPRSCLGIKSVYKFVVAFCFAKSMFPLASLGVSFILLLAPSSGNWI